MPDEYMKNAKANLTNVKVLSLKDNEEQTSACNSAEATSTHNLVLNSFN